MNLPPAAEDTTVTTLANGVRVLNIHLPRRATANVSVFVRTGSQHESRRLNGISHVAEHMAFKGTASRDCQRINLDAERLGAEVNAHTDKDHTAFHIAGLAADAPGFVRMLGDIVLNSTFPEAELARERQVILQELAEDEEDPPSVAFRLFDKACWGEHALAQPVIGTRRNIERFSRDELLQHLQRQYTGRNIVVGVAGDVDAAALQAAVQDCFGALPAGDHNLIAPPAWTGGLRSRSLPGSTQTQLVLGFPMPAQREQPQAHVVAAALFGEGMSSPFVDQIRERRGLAYYLACSADVGELGGQFVIEAATAPEQAETYLAEVHRLLAEQAGAIDPVALERARRQLAVRSLRALEAPSRRLEAAALDLFVHGRVRSAQQLQHDIDQVTAEQVHAVFQGLLGAPVALALAGRVGPRLLARAREIFLPAAPLSRPAPQARRRSGAVPSRAVRPGGRSPTAPRPA